MNKENRTAVIVMGGILFAGVLFVGYKLFWAPLLDYNQQIDTLETANLEKETQIAQILKDRAKLAAWRRLSLPPPDTRPRPKNASPSVRERDNRQTQVEYIDFLYDLLKKHRLVYEYPKAQRIDDKSAPKVSGNTTAYTSLTFTVAAKGKLQNIVTLLEEFQKTPILHRIRTLDIKTTEGKEKEPLALAMTVEALIVNGSTNPGVSLTAISQAPAALDAALIGLRRRPTGLGLFPWKEIYARAVSPKRTYTDIARQNIFEGGAATGKTTITFDPSKPLTQPPQPTPDLISHAYLTGVTIAASTQATIFDRSYTKWFAERKIDLKTSYGYNTFPLVKDCDSNTVVRGDVLSIDTRGIIFRVRLVARSPAEEGSKTRFKTVEAIYSLPEEDVSALVAAGKAKLSEKDRLYKMHKYYWEVLQRDKVVTLRGPTFAFRSDMIRGKFVLEQDGFVTIRMDEKYCSFRSGNFGGFGRQGGVAPHEGYCFLGIGENLTRALQTPLTAVEAQKGLPTASAHTP